MRSRIGGRRRPDWLSPAGPGGRGIRRGWRPPVVVAPYRLTGCRTRCTAGGAAVLQQCPTPPQAGFDSAFPKRAGDTRTGPQAMMEPLGSFAASVVELAVEAGEARQQEEVEILLLLDLRAPVPRAAKTHSGQQVQASRVAGRPTWSAVRRCRSRHRRRRHQSHA